MKQNNVFTLIAVAIIVGVVGFFAGIKYQENKRSAFSRQFGQLQRTGNRTGFRPVSGEILKTDETSLTVKLSDGSSKIILFSETTEINKAEKIDKQDLKAGEKIAVFGRENADGSISAQNIQLNPVLRTNPMQKP